MIHLIVILHFAAISMGMITLSVAWIRNRDHKEAIWQWIIYTDLLFTINMILDAIRIYFSKNVAAMPEYFWAVVGILVCLFSIITLYAAVKLIAKITGNSPFPRLMPVFCLAAVMPFAAPHLVPWFFDLLIIGCLLYAAANLSLVPPKHRGVTITLLSVLAIYLPVYTAINLLPGTPHWISKIPYTQIIYLGTNLLGLKYFLQEAPTEKAVPEEVENLQSFGNIFSLTEREIEIVREIAAGKNNKEISEQLFISPNTVKNHIYNIYKKTGIKNRYELIVHFARNESDPL